MPCLAVRIIIPEEQDAESVVLVILQHLALHSCSGL
jgi:hypothetical protein